MHCIGATAQGFQQIESTWTCLLQAEQSAGGKESAAFHTTLPPMPVVSGYAIWFMWPFRLPDKRLNWLGIVNTMLLALATVASVAFFAWRCVLSAQEEKNGDTIFLLVLQSHGWGKGYRVGIVLEGWS